MGKITCQVHVGTDAGSFMAVAQPLGMSWRAMDGYGFGILLEVELTWLVVSNIFYFP